MVKRNAIATKLTKRCTQTQKRAFDVAVSVEKPLKKDYIQKRWSPEVKRQVVELAKTKSRKEIQEQLNVPGPTIR